MAIDFVVPELGENVKAGDVVRVLVKAGDTIAKDQPALELETDKATIEVPSRDPITQLRLKLRVPGGALELAEPGPPGAAFALTLPLSTEQEPACPASSSSTTSRSSAA